MTDNECFFDFVYGDENHVCFQALREFADGKHVDTEPILLIGQSGLGKTHLLRTLYQRITEKPFFDKILYQTGADLIQNFIRQMLKTGAEKGDLLCYQDLDILLVDDLSCLYDKASTQLEILHFIDTMTQQGTRVLCTLNELLGCEEFFASRFPGKVLTLAPPSSGTIQRIIERKAVDHGLSITMSQTLQIEAKTKGNGFLIEGVMKRYAFQKSVTFCRGGY